MIVYNCVGNSVTVLTIAHAQDGLERMIMGREMRMNTIQYDNGYILMIEI